MTIISCPKCGAKIVVETDDSKHAEKRIEKWRKAHKCKNGGVKKKDV